MIDLYYWTTPNGHKITICLEELELPYKIMPVNLSKEEQFKSKFLKISPNNKIPAIVDHEPMKNDGPITIFESGAILLYLAEKEVKFIPTTLGGRFNTLQWLFWQMAGLGPMSGQYNYFARNAPEKIPLAIDRYTKETLRLYGVLDKQLDLREFIADSYSIADMACYPWIVRSEVFSQHLEKFPNIKRWVETIKVRSAVIRAYEKAKQINPS